MRYFYDVETMQTISESELARELEELKKEDFEHDDVTLEEYINNCLTRNNGTLEEV
jgi:hypothetical protein